MMEGGVMSCTGDTLSQLRTFQVMIGKKDKNSQVATSIPFHTINQSHILSGFSTTLQTSYQEIHHQGRWSHAPSHIACVAASCGMRTL